MSNNYKNKGQPLFELILLISGVQLKNIKKF